MRLKSNQIINIIQAVEIVKVEEAKRRVDFEVPKGTTFFSGEDIWLYDPREDPKTCPICRGYADLSAQMGGFNGNYLRSLFPYLTILDTNTIGGPGDAGKGLAHPNCRCYLNRYIGDPKLAVPAQKGVLGKYTTPKKTDFKTIPSKTELDKKADIAKYIYNKKKDSN